MNFYWRLMILGCFLLFLFIYGVIEIHRPMMKFDDDLPQDVFPNDPDIVNKIQRKDVVNDISNQDILKNNKNNNSIKGDKNRSISNLLVKVVHKYKLQTDVSLNLRRSDMGVFYGAISIGEAKKNVYIKPNNSTSKLANVKIEQSITCNHECIAFQRLLVEWPRNKPKAAIYYLTRSNRLDMLKISMTSIERHFNLQRQYPIIVFHESDLDSNASRFQIRSYIKTPVFFQLVSFDIPSFMNRSEVRFNISCESHISYRHMCRFHALGVYQQPILKGLDYAWRLDDDSIIMGDITYDVFETMREGQFLYGYKVIFWDALACTEGLWPATSRYIEENQIKAEFFSDWRVAQIYYNNFEISALALWMSREYQDYISYIDCLGGIYHHRWGDAPIKSLAVSMFVPKRKTYKFTNIQYKHTSFVNNSF